MAALTMDPGHSDDREDNAPPCHTCKGSRQIDIGDVEDGVVDECPACEGTGKEPQGDRFIPEWDAWRAGE